VKTPVTQSIIYAGLTGNLKNLFAINEDQAMSFDKLIVELKDFYYNHTPYPHQFEDLMDAYDKSHPGLNAYQLKAMQYEVLAENYKPVIFKNSPFYFEMGTKIAQCDGSPGFHHPGAWLIMRNEHMFRDYNPADMDRFSEQIGQRLFLSCGPYVDLDHHCPSFTNVLEHGLEGIYKQAEESLKTCTNQEETDFIESAMRGLLAVKRVAERFGDSAEALLNETSDEKQRQYLQMIATSSRRSPWHKPETFYEGLNTLWFLREICGVMEGIGSNSLGHPDRMLIDLYNRDIEAGRLTKEEAYDLICRFLLIADCHYDKEKSVVVYSDHEFELTFTLGGCDRHGNEVLNDITFMFLKAHHDLKLIYPKPHCRFSETSDAEYLKVINIDFLSGRSVLHLINDDCIIPSLVRAGKSLEDARSYLCTGCWDVVVEGCENMATGNYFSMPRILEMSIHDCPETANTGVVCEKLDGVKDFEELYQRIFGNIIKPLRDMCEMKGRNGRVWPKVNPSPFFSACMSDCLKNHKDYTAGGGRYNPHAMPMVGFANIIDSLLVIRELCFETKRYTLDELLTAVRANWKGYEVLHAEILRMPHFGDDEPESNAVAQRLHDDLYNNTRDLVNERGGAFELGYWIYREIRYWGEKLLATPDGRYSGDVIAHGITPSRLRHIGEITSAINSIASLDMTKCSSDSVVNVLLPMGDLSTTTLDQFERAFAAQKLQLLQLNCVSRKDLLDAQIHPEKHQDLIVRVCGFSAKFVVLSKEWQDEFISRNIYE
jgi:formate C-acetyltransferase